MFPNVLVVGVGVAAFASSSPAQVQTTGLHARSESIEESQKLHEYVNEEMSPHVELDALAETARYPVIHATLVELSCPTDDGTAAEFESCERLVHDRLSQLSVSNPQCLATVGTVVEYPVPWSYSKSPSLHWTVNEFTHADPDVPEI